MTNIYAIAIDRPNWLHLDSSQGRQLRFALAALEKDGNWQIVLYPDSPELRAWMGDAQWTVSDKQPEAYTDSALASDLVRDPFDKIVLPEEFLPCVDDAAQLLVMADYLEELGSPLCKLLRWTANEWNWRRGLPRAQCQEGLSVWARFSAQGWSRAVISSVRQRHVTVEFPHRNPNRNGPQRGIRDWWDLVLRERGAKKPKPRKGFSTGVNARLAAALMGMPWKGKEATARIEPKLYLFTDEPRPTA